MQWKTLVATSDPNIAEMVGVTLSTLEINYQNAHDGTSLLTRVYEEPYRLVVLDATLDGLDGFEACRRLRELDWLQDTPIIMLTSDWEEQTILNVYQSKANDFLVMPLQENLLEEKLKMWLERWNPSIGDDGSQSQTSLPPIGAIETGHTVGGRYRVIREVGRGGMGAVYQVWDERLHTDLAMKVVSTHEWERNDEVQQRFQREVDALAKLKHPYIVRIYDTNTWDLFRYYTMEHLPNGTLHQMVQNKQYSTPIEFLSLIAKIAEALAFTHERGIIHRDLKSSNILISEANTPVLIDFGSMITSEFAETRLTPGEFVIGTPYFMAPEQLTSPEKVDHRCDIYSLGAVLFEFLTGQVPFAGLNVHDAMLAVVQEGIPAPSDIVPTTDPQLEALCLRATAYKPDERFQRADDFAEACRHIAAALRISSPSPLPAIKAELFRP